MSKNFRLGSSAARKNSQPASWHRVAWIAKRCGLRRSSRFAGPAGYSESVSSATLTGRLAPWCSIRLRLV
jgi:hypothetical protein